MPAPLPFASPVGSIVWSPHQMLRRGTASTDRAAKRLVGDCANATWLWRRSPSPGGGTSRGAANIAFPEAPATLRDSTWKRSARSQCAPLHTVGVSLPASLHARIARPPCWTAEVPARAGQLSVEVRSAAAGCHKVVAGNSTQATCPCCERRTSPACAYSLGYGDTAVRASGHGPGGSRGNAERSIRR